MTRADQGQRPSVRRPGLAARLAAAAVQVRSAGRRYTRRRAAVLNASPGTYLPDPSRAPEESYQEFLFRTSGPLMREPAAASRSTGR